MSPLEILRKPLEALAGEPYPDEQEVAREATLQGEWASGVGMSIAYEKKQWHGHLVHLDGVRKFIRNLRGMEQ